MVQHGLIALNGRFRKSEKKLRTFMYPNGEKAQHDLRLGKKNEEIASKTVDLTTLLILSTQIT